MSGNFRILAVVASLALGACALEPVVNKGTISIDGKSYPFEQVYQPVSYGPGGTTSYFVTVDGVRISCSPSLPICQAEARQFLEYNASRTSAPAIVVSESPAATSGGFEYGD